jgi:GNAT superfamily N-acetyltransferase
LPTTFEPYTSATTDIVNCTRDQQRTSLCVSALHPDKALNDSKWIGGGPEPLASPRDLPQIADMRSQRPQPAEVTLTAAHSDDFEDLVTLRVEAMRESLERIGRFDAARARARFRGSFAPEFTRHILWQTERVGCVAVSPAGEGLSLDHLYVAPRHQGHGIGSAVLAIIFAEADAAGLALRVGALRESGSNRFYVRHGFVPSAESEWDIYYVRPPANARADVSAQHSPSPKRAQ